MEKIRITDHSAIKLPAALRREFDLKKGDELIAERTDAGILLRPLINVPLEIYSEERIDEFASDEAAVRGHLDKLS